MSPLPSIRLWISVMVLTSATPLWAKRPIPLMPPPLDGHEFTVGPPVTAPVRQQRRVRRDSVLEAPPLRRMAARGQRRSRMRTRSHVAARSSSEWLGGFELGMLGRRNASNGDVGGLRMLYGGRAFVALPLTDKLFLKPSLGFFLRGSGEGQLSVTEFLAEAGAGVQYQVARSGSVTWLVGAVGRLEGRFSKTSVGALEESSSTGHSSLSPLLFRFRMGPTGGLTYRASPNLGLLLDFELSFSFTQPVRPHAGLVAGAVFRL